MAWCWGSHYDYGGYFGLYCRVSRCRSVYCQGKKHYDVVDYNSYITLMGYLRSLTWWLSLRILTDDHGRSIEIQAINLFSFPHHKVLIVLERDESQSPSRSIFAPPDRIDIRQNAKLRAKTIPRHEWVAWMQKWELTASSYTNTIQF